MSDQPASNALGDEFDQAMRRMHGLPDTVSTKASTVTVTEAAFGMTTQDWIIQTIRRSERHICSSKCPTECRDEGRVVKSNDVAFVRYMDHRGAHRFVLPNEVLNTIVRQRDALGTKNKRNSARETMRRRKASGEDLGAALRDPKVQKAARAARKAKAAKRAARRTS